MVAVAVPVSPPVQHSPILGHRASSQTVFSFNSRNFDLIALYLSPPGTTIFIQSGFGRGFFLVPTSTEYPSGAELECVMKSTKLGPPFASLSRNELRAGVAGVDNSLVVAAPRICCPKTDAFCLYRKRAGNPKTLPPFIFN